MRHQNTAYFLGSNSSTGFFSYFDQLIDLKSASHVYYLKGGPGTGKSSFMKTIAAHAEALSHPVDYIHCSSDPDSLDGIVIRDLGVAMIDATSPHTVDPIYPGAVDEILNLGQFWDSSHLAERREQIIELTTAVSQNFTKTYRYIGAANYLLRDNEQLMKPAILQKKIDHYAEKFIKKQFKPRAAEGLEKKRFLSGITPKGPVCYSGELRNICERLYVVEDSYYTAPILLEKLRDGALQNGYDVISYYCPMNPRKLEHLYFPALALGVTVSDEFHPYAGDFEHRISTQRFINKELLPRCKARMKFNRKCAKSLLEGAYTTLAAAKETHDALEAAYIDAMDFDAVTALSEQICDRIFSSRS